jgi:GNAT superfamily N-acetyltransferase
VSHRGKLSIDIEAAPAQADLDFIEQGLTEHDRVCRVAWGEKPLAAFLRDAEGQVVGGLHGLTASRWLYVARLWVSEGHRGVGYGTRLMEAAEREAIFRSCRYAHLETYSFQALDFYLGLRYTVFATLEDYPAGHTKYFLKKALL